MKCYREEIITAVKQIIREKFENKNEFTVPEVIHTMINNHVPYEMEAVRTQITTRLCANAPSAEYNDFECIRKGFYKLL